MFFGKEKLEGETSIEKEDVSTVEKVQKSDKKPVKKNDLRKYKNISGKYPINLVGYKIAVGGIQEIDYGRLITEHKNTVKRALELQQIEEVK